MVQNDNIRELYGAESTKEALQKDTFKVDFADSCELKWTTVWTVHIRQNYTHTTLCVVV